MTVLCVMVGCCQCWASWAGLLHTVPCTSLASTRSIAMRCNMGQSKQKLLVAAVPGNVSDKLAVTEYSLHTTHQGNVVLAVQSQTRCLNGMICSLIYSYDTGCSPCCSCLRRHRLAGLGLDSDHLTIPALITLTKSSLSKRHRLLESCCWTNTSPSQPASST
jgi:hypothetical protein